jgi:hypothetical protein
MFLGLDVDAKQAHSLTNDLSSREPGPLRRILSPQLQESQPA